MGCVMFADKPQFRVRLGLRLLVASAAAALLTGCSDATRLSSNPFSNPFETASSGPVDRTPTGTIAPRAPSSSSMKIESKPLAPPSGSSALPAPSVTPQPVAPRPVAAQPVAPSRTSAASIDHWSAEGGTPIVVAQGETARALSERYGVPQDALLRVNGFNSASQLQPGARLVVPVYRATATATRAAAPAPAPVAAAPAPKAEAPKEKFRLVKGPEPAAKATSTKAAKVEKDDDEDETDTKKVAPATKPVDKKKVADKKIEDKAKAASNKAASKKDDDDDEDETPAAKTAPAKPVKQKQAEVAPAPEPKVEPKKEVRKIEMRQAEAKPAAKSEVSSETTASLPKEEPKAAASEGANPEFRWPARGRVIQGFKSGGNDGINIAVPEGTAVKAAEGGVVKYAGNELKGYGNLVLIQHPNGFVSAYAHNGELDVKRGDTVKRGQTIAKAGQTGNVSSPQVHFELRKGSTPVDPTGYLAGL